MGAQSGCPPCDTAPGGGEVKVGIDAQLLLQGADASSSGRTLLAGPWHRASHSPHPLLTLMVPKALGCLAAPRDMLEEP